jgi:hypothetical protein
MSMKMTPTPASAQPLAVVDVITSLLESTVNSVFRFMGEGSPYLSRATVEVRRPLQEMVVANQRRGAELAALLESLGAPTTVKRSPQADEQYLAYLSLKFLLPKLVEEKKLCVARYENALAGIKPLPQVPAEAPALLNAHLAEQRRELAALEQAATHVSARNGKAEAGNESEAESSKSETNSKPE